MRLLFGPGFDGSPGDARSYQSLLADLKSRTAPWARSLARLERPADNREVASPNLAGPIPRGLLVSLGVTMPSTRVGTKRGHLPLTEADLSISRWRLAGAATPNPQRVSSDTPNESAH